MKKASIILLALLLCLLSATALAADVPASTSKLPDMLSFPSCPQIVRVQQDGASITITLDRALPSESLVTALAINGSCHKADINAAPGSGNTYTASGLVSGGQWVGFEIAWVSGGVNAVARYSISGGLERVTRFDGRYNEYVYNGSGRFVEFGYRNNGVRARFNSRGELTSYAYQAKANTMVWFNLAGEVVSAQYDDGALAAAWEPGAGWYVSIGTGRVSVRLNVDPTSASPLLPPEEEEEEEEEKVVWYPNNTIGLAGLSMQEASPRFPDKWYNVVPVNLTAQGRQTFFLVITNNKFIGECYVDVYGDEVTVSYDLIENGSIEVLSHYGRWFTRLSDVTAASIEANDAPIPFGQPLSISQDLDGADVALLFIRSKATYRMPFRDGSALTEYWRNKPDWKAFRKDLTNLMQYVDP